MEQREQAICHWSGKLFALPLTKYGIQRLGLVKLGHFGVFFQYELLV